MTDYKTKFPESFNNAEKIIKLIDDNNFDGEENILSIVGRWGAGKSKIKEILENILLKKKQKVIEFNAIEFEEKSQVTSELYNTISKSFYPKYRLIPMNLCVFSKFHKFRAIAQLKKESNAQSLSSTFILGVIVVGICSLLFGKIINQLNKLNLITYILEHVPHFFNNEADDPIAINKIIISVIFIFFLIAIVDYLLKITSGISPRKSHIEILKTIKFKEKTILLIDEIDRISEDSIRYLFNEINTLSSQKYNNFIILLFSDKKAILELSQNNSKQISRQYLQKFYDNEYIIPMYTFIEEKPYLYSFWQFINSQILSFRDANRYNTFIVNNFEKMKSWYTENTNIQIVGKTLDGFLSKKHIYQSSQLNRGSQKVSADLILDNTIMLVLYLAFRYPMTNQLTLINMLRKIEAFMLIVRLECFDHNKEHFFPTEDDIVKKFDSSGIVAVAKYLWYGLVRFNICTNEYFQLEQTHQNH